MIVAVAHTQFKKMSPSEIKMLFRDCLNQEKVLLDVKGIFQIGDLCDSGMT